MLITREKLTQLDFLSQLNALLKQHPLYEDWMMFTKAYYNKGQLMLESSSHPEMEKMASFGKYVEVFHSTQEEFLKYYSLV